jgi:hypothetical protein
MFEPKPSDPAGADYEQDLALWYDRQIALLRAHRFGELDLTNLIEELDSMVRNLRRELASRLEVLIMHLLKCQYQPQRISRNWLGTLAEQRSEIDKLLEENPSFGPTLMKVADKVYRAAARRAGVETRLPGSTLPAVNPYTRDQLLDSDYVPGVHRA